MGVRGLGQHLGQPALPVVVSDQVKMRLPGEAGWQGVSEKGEGGWEVIEGKTRPPPPEAREAGVGSGKEGAKEAHPEWIPAMWGFPEPHNSLQRRDRSPVFPGRLGLPLPGSPTPLCPAEGPGEPALLLAAPS